MENSWDPEQIPRFILDKFQGFFGKKSIEEFRDFDPKISLVSDSRGFSLLNIGKGPSVDDWTPTRGKFLD